MKNVKAGVLRSDRDRKIGQWQPVIAVGCVCGEVAHRGEHTALHSAIDRDLAEALQVSVDCGDLLALACVDRQLVAHGPAPCDIPSLDRCQEQLPGSSGPARHDPRGGVGEHGALAAPNGRGHRLGPPVR